MTMPWLREKRAAGGAAPNRIPSRVRAARPRKGGKRNGGGLVGAGRWEAGPAAGRDRPVTLHARRVREKRTKDYPQNLSGSHCVIRRGAAPTTAGSWKKLSA